MACPPSMLPGALRKREDEEWLLWVVDNDWCSLMMIDDLWSSHSWWWIMIYNGSWCFRVVNDAYETTMEEIWSPRMVETEIVSQTGHRRISSLRAHENATWSVANANTGLYQASPAPKDLPGALTKLCILWQRIGRHHGWTTRRCTEASGACPCPTFERLGGSARPPTRVAIPWMADVMCCYAW